MAHTPGPWTIVYEDADGNLLNGVTIDSCEGPVAFNVIDCSAPLIAAAPELLDALQLFVELDADGSLHIDGSPATEDPVITAAKRAIAKAEGRE
jgi:hypothetical protein